MSICAGWAITMKDEYKIVLQFKRQTTIHKKFGRNHTKSQNNYKNRESIRDATVELQVKII